MTKPTWKQRIERAEKLARTYPFASELLHFYCRISSFQEDLYKAIVSACGSQVENRRNGSLQDELDLGILLPWFPPFLTLVEEKGPVSLTESAGNLARRGPLRWPDFLTGYWISGNQNDRAEGNPERFFAQAFLQPYAEYLADHTKHPQLDSRPRVCPLCQRKPQVGVLRQEGDGAKRSLVCSLCSTEWDYRRLVCPACGEENADKLAVYTAAQFDYVRIEACDTCKSYLKTVDLTKNGLAVPVVDELATLPLDLWAQENGYSKLQPNLMGM